MNTVKICYVSHSGIQSLHLVCDKCIIKTSSSINKITYTNPDENFQHLKVTEIAITFNNNEKISSLGETSLLKLNK